MDWATEHYEVDQATHEVLLRLTPVGDVPRLPTSSHVKATGGRRKPPNPPLEKCAQCVIQEIASHFSTPPSPTPPSTPPTHPKSRLKTL